MQDETAQASAKQVATESSTEIEQAVAASKATCNDLAEEAETPSFRKGEKGLSGKGVNEAACPLSLLAPLPPNIH